MYLCGVRISKIFPFLVVVQRRSAFLYLLCSVCCQRSFEGGNRHVSYSVHKNNRGRSFLPITSQWINSPRVKRWGIEEWNLYNVTSIYVFLETQPGKGVGSNVLKNGCSQLKIIIAASLLVFICAVISFPNGYN